MPPLNSTHQTLRPAAVSQDGLFLRTCGFVLLLAGACAVPASAQQKSQLPDGPGKEATERVCSACHGAEIVMGRGLTRDGWTEVVTEMIQRGAQGSEDDFAQIVDYLAKNFPPKSDGSKSGGEKKSGSADNSNKSSEPAK
jgi:mono/diheme cytochrome c family protein